MNNVTKMGVHPLLEMIQRKYPDYHPIMALADMAHRPTISPEIELQCHKSIADYITPKVKSVEVKQRDDRRRVTISMFGEDTEEQIEEVEIYSAGSRNDLITVR